MSGRVGVAHWSVSFRSESGRAELDGILVCDFEHDGRCKVHREWYERRDVPAAAAGDQTEART